jgi:hypothetical protein
MHGNEGIKKKKVVDVILLIVAYNSSGAKARAKDANALHQNDLFKNH